MISSVQLGTIDYATGLRLQEQLVALRKEEKIGDALLLLEHSPVITLGRNAKAANVVASPELLKNRGLELFECDRGGDVTFHGPGQIVGYPIFDLRGFARSTARFDDLSSRAEENDSKNRSLESRDLAFAEAVQFRQDASECPSALRKTLGVVEFVRRLEQVLICTCADFAIETKRVPGLTGVWTDEVALRGRDFSRAEVAPITLSSRADENDSENRSLQSRACPERAKRVEGNHGLQQNPEAKLAAIGVHVSRFVTSHGFALNVNTDLSYFDLIIPCGITSKPVTSMQRELGRPLDLNGVAESISRNFGVIFQTQVLWVDSLDALLGRAVPS